MVLSIKPRSTICKARSLAAVLSIQYKMSHSNLETGKGTSLAGGCTGRGL